MVSNNLRHLSYADFSALPRRAAAAYAARCARRLFLLTRESVKGALDDETTTEADHLIKIVEGLVAFTDMEGWFVDRRLQGLPVNTDAFRRDEFLAQARKFELLSPAWFHPKTGGRFSGDPSTSGFSKGGRIRVVPLDQISQIVTDARSTVAIALWVASAIPSHELDRNDDYHWSQEGLRDLAEIYERSPQGVRRGMQEDFYSIRDQASKLSWSHSTPVSPGFWPLHLKFDLERTFDGRSILTISSIVNDQLIAYFRKHPNRMNDLTARQFEELIAELWYRVGFEVELTQATIDGGCDVIAIQHAPLKVKYLIECKKYRADRPVGVHIVRQLGGVILRHIADSIEQRENVRGILATTSTFTRPAQVYLRETSYWLEGADSNRIVDWLDRYDRYRMASDL